MSESNERDGAAEVAKVGEAMARQIEPIERIVRDSEPLIRQIEQVERIVRGSEALRRQVEPIVQRRLKAAIQALAAETVKARKSANRGAVMLVALTAALVALTVVLAVKQLGGRGSRRPVSSVARSARVRPPPPS